MAYSLLGRNPTVISHNVRGLNTPEKRTTLLREIKKGKPHFVLLQETHFKTGHVPRLTDSNFTKVFHATNNLAKTKGVSILVSKNAPFDLTDQLIDPEGRYIFLKGHYSGTPITIANVYFPNSAHLPFCKQMTHKLQEFAKGCLILGGDFNIPLNPLTDTSNGNTNIRYQTLKGIKSLLHKLGLVDSWRFLNPQGRDYTFYSAPHKKYTRIDYLFITQKDLPVLTEACIGTQSFSDHAPVAVTLDLTRAPKKTQIWRLNSSILSDPTHLPKLKEAL